MEYLKGNKIMNYLQVIYLQISFSYERTDIMDNDFISKGSHLLSLISFEIEFQKCTCSVVHELS